MAVVPTQVVKYWSKGSNNGQKGQTRFKISYGSINGSASDNVQGVYGQILREWSNHVMNGQIMCMTVKLCE